MFKFLAPESRSIDIAVPKMTDISSEYVEIIKLEDELNEKIPRHIAEMKEIRQRHGGNAPAFATAAKYDDAVQTRLAKLLNGFAPTVARADPENQDADRYYDLVREVDYIRDTALPQIAEKRRSVMQAASRVICERVEDDHRAIVREMAARLRELHEVNARYWALTSALASDGVSWGRLGPAFFRPAGHPGDPNGPIAEWFKEAARSGHISESEIPQDFRR